MKYTAFFLSIILILAGVWVSSWTVGADKDTVPYISTAAWVIVGFGALIGGYSFWEAISYQHRENLEARYRTADVRFVEAIKGSSAETMYLVKLHLSAMLHIFPWANGWVTVIGHSGVPKGFAAEFLRKGDNTNLASINKWADGSLWLEPGNPQDFGECRRLAHDLTEYLLDIGVAKNSFGNNPPRWVDGVTPSLLRAAWGIPLSIHKQDDLRPAQPIEELYSAEESR